jgi:hypothetical protein
LKLVDTRSSGQKVIAARAIHLIIAIATENRVVARDALVEQGITNQPIISEPPHNEVVATHVEDGFIALVAM